MIYADNARVVSQPPEQLRKMMRVVMVVQVTVGLAVSEAKTEINVFTHEEVGYRIPPPYSV